MTLPAVTVTEITDENRDDLMERMTGMSRWQASRCMYDPKTGEVAEPFGSGCQKEASIEVGSRSSTSWYLCASCADLPKFKRFTSRYPLPSLYDA